METKPHTILIVDDEIANIESLFDAITEMDESFNVLIANSAKTALKILKSESPDVIITDWYMPEMNGIEFIIEVKNNPKTADIPVIMCSGIMTSSQNLKTALDAGAIDYIRKPIDIIELTARINSTLKLSESYKTIKELNATKDKFISILAHDLKNSFNALIGFSDLLVSQIKNANIKTISKYAHAISETSLNTYDFLEEMLEWARVQQSEIIFEPVNIQVKALTENCYILLSNLAEEKNISLNHNIASNATVFADENMVKTILRNLITNSIKFTERGGEIKVSVKNTEKNTEIYVADNGIGMNAEIVDTLFKIEKTKSQKGTNGEKGTGFGLVLCKEFTDKHKGTIRVESEENVGTSFIITLPNQRKP